MERSAKILTGATLLARKYGKTAPVIARRRARQSSRRRDHAAVSAWLAIADAATALLRRQGCRASLSDVLEGAVTQQMMKADQVSRGDVERLMQQKKRRRDP